MHYMVQKRRKQTIEQHRLRSKRMCCARVSNPSCRWSKGDDLMLGRTF